MVADLRADEMRRQGDVTMDDIVSDFLTDVTMM